MAANTDANVRHLVASFENGNDKSTAAPVAVEFVEAKIPVFLTLLCSVTSIHRGMHMRKKTLGLMGIEPVEAQLLYRFVF
jgi:hypothetical protein